MNANRDEIAARAYRIWEAEGRPADKAEEHWLRAEQELAGRARQQQTAITMEFAPSSEPAAPATVVASKRKATRSRPGRAQPQQS